MDTNENKAPEKKVSPEKLHPGSEQNDPQKEKIDMAKSANSATQDAGLNKSEHEEQVKASLNKNDINQNIVELQEVEGERSSENEARSVGPYGFQEEGYGDDSNEPIAEN
jgi:hypothetical protein